MVWHWVLIQYWHIVVLSDSSCNIVVFAESCSSVGLSVSQELLGKTLHTHSAILNPSLWMKTCKLLLEPEKMVEVTCISFIIHKTAASVVVDFGLSAYFMSQENKTLYLVKITKQDLWTSGHFNQQKSSQR